MSMITSLLTWSWRCTCKVVLRCLLGICVDGFLEGPLPAIFRLHCCHHWSSSLARPAEALQAFMANCVSLGALAGIVSFDSGMKFTFRILVYRPFLANARSRAAISSSMTLCLHRCRLCRESMIFAIMQMLAWLSVAMISS